MKTYKELLEAINENLLNKLEKFAGKKIKPGRNNIAGCPVDIDDGDPEEGITMTAVDRSAAIDLSKKLKSAKFKVTTTGKDILIEGQ